MKNDPKRDTPGLRVKVYVRDDMIGMGKVDLLRLVAREASIPAAARAMGVDDERAAFLLDTLQRCFADPLWTAQADGAASLTDLGRELIRRHDEHLAAIATASAPYLEWLEDRQAAGAPTASDDAS